MDVLRVLRIHKVHLVLNMIVCPIWLHLELRRHYLLMHGDCVIWEKLVGWQPFYAAATGLRLARFNVHLSDSEVKTQDFSGLPCPAAAGFVVSMIWLALVYHLQGRTYNIIGAFLIVFAALMMVSNIPYRSFKDKDFRDKVPFLLILVVLLLFVGIALDPPHVLAAIFTLYLLSGFVAWVRH